MTPPGQIVELARYRIPAGERALQCAPTRSRWPSGAASRGAPRPATRRLPLRRRAAVGH